jgi:hypothetical protein
VIGSTDNCVDEGGESSGVFREGVRIAESIEEFLMLLRSRYVLSDLVKENM